MAFLDETFDIAEMPVTEQRSFDPVPAGWYTAAIAGAELKTTKAGTGNYIAVRFDITGPLLGGITTQPGRASFTITKG